ncbi:hypothetical protein O5344_08635 [Escherichia coli]|uniref:hypothetical protein n=1 Tax=Escherichia coli TaxID=562 RepID=UPI0022B303CF|nr:hypothetical protein [Escherichia coli]EHJ8079600.1 hypothetical protein [Escherichia coli]EHU6057757.1 hypothetical protein [Escherichia coli]MCZ5962015.1 hypothetical protein [Escherichia coli]HBN4972296.1 hypothetical protein [Escherichia coli]
MHTTEKINNQKKPHNRAIDLTEHWLRVAIKIIDRSAGEGYAKAHPELISAFMTTVAANFATLTEREIAGAEQVTTINVKTGEHTA